MTPIKIYQARDKTEFRTRKECREHEFMLDLEYFLSTHIGDDCTLLAKAILAAYTVKKIKEDK